jgi:hypothetical protein
MIIIKVTLTVTLVSSLRVVYRESLKELGKLLDCSKGIREYTGNLRKGWHKHL